MTSIKRSINTNKFKIFFICFIFTLLFSCSYIHKESADKVNDKDIIVLYENDVHCAMDGYSSYAAYRTEALNTTPYVTTVSCGDFIQGESIGAFTQGNAIVRVMNNVGYNLVTLGNHEFDYGMPKLFTLTKKLKATIVNCNFCSTKTYETIFTPFRIIKYKNKKIAYIGVTTPTAQAISPYKFQNKEGNFIYGFKSNLLETVQQSVNESRKKGADYVIILSHLGNNPTDSCNSISLIKNTRGIDVVLDGHSHSIIPQTFIENKDGKSVLLTSTGSKFKNIGVLTLSPNGHFTSRLVGTDNFLKEEPHIQKIINKEEAKLKSVFNRIIGHTDFELSIYDKSRKQTTRYMECPLGNLCCDAFRHTSGTDIAIINGGNIRMPIKAGNITYQDIINVLPFLNTICTGTITGKQLQDALEVCVSKTPYESGHFPQVSGIRFDIDTSKTAQIIYDKNGIFDHIEGLSRRISHLQIYDNKNNTFVPINKDTTYTITSTNYLLKEKGDGGILRYVHFQSEIQHTDTDCLSQYIESHLNKIIPNYYRNLDGRINIK